MQIPQRTAESLSGLESMIKYLGSKYNLLQLNLIEVGSWVGISSMLFANYFKKVICVDPFEPVENTITMQYDMNKVEEIFNFVILFLWKSYFTPFVM